MLQLVLGCALSATEKLNKKKTKRQNSQTKTKKKSLQRYLTISCISLSKHRMNVYLALVGLFLVGVAQCSEINDFEKIVQNSNVFGKPDEKFWWMSQGSPFKRAVSSQPKQQFNFEANPFLRSKFFPHFIGYFSYTKKKFMTGNIYDSLTIQYILNGLILAIFKAFICWENNRLDHKTFDGGHKIKMPSAKFEHISFSFSIFFLGNRQAAPSAKLYSAPGYLPPEPQKPQTVPCQGNGRVCVPKYQCQGGSVDASQVSGQNSQVHFSHFISSIDFFFWFH